MGGEGADSIIQTGAMPPWQKPKATPNAVGFGPKNDKYFSRNGGVHGVWGVNKNGPCSYRVLASFSNIVLQNVCVRINPDITQKM